MPSIACFQCGTTFDKPASHIARYKTHFCSTACHDAYRRKRVAVACAVCDTLIELRPSRLNQAKEFTCSTACLKEYRKRMQIRARGTEQDRHATCNHCGQPFTRKPSQLNTYTNHYCSHACKSAAEAGIPREKTGAEFPCETCGKPVYRTQGVLLDRVFCSRACAKTYNTQRLRVYMQSPDGKAMVDRRIKKHRGVNHPRWKGGASLLPYTPGFTKDLKQAILDRDQHTCQLCKCHTDLVVHHIDFGKTNHHPENLLTVCRSCHGRIHNHKVVVIRL